MSSPASDSICIVEEPSRSDGLSLRLSSSPLPIIRFIDHFRRSTAGAAVEPATEPDFLVALPPTTNLCYSTAVAVRTVRILYLAVCGTELYGTRYSHVMRGLALR